MHSTPPTIPTSRLLVIPYLCMGFMPTLADIRQMRVFRRRRRRSRQYRLRRLHHLRHLRLSQGRLSPHRRRLHRYRWTCRVRRILTRTRSQVTATSKPSGQLSTRAEEKKLRRSNRKPNPNQSKPPAAKPTPSGTKKNVPGTKPVLEHPDQASKAAKLNHRREKRAWKYAEKHPGVDVPRPMTTANKDKQIQQHQASKK